MKVALINPSREYKGNLDARAAAPPLGLLYLASSLMKEGHEVRLIDQLGTGLNDSTVVSQVKGFYPDLVGFSTMGSQSKSAARLTRKFKKVLPNTPVVFGGINPTFSSEYIMKKYPMVDYCIEGEGEHSLLELLKALKNKAFDSVHGLVYRVGSKIKRGKPRELITDLDSLPFPDRSLIKGIEYGSLSGLRVRGFTSFLSSRGCPFACTFCCCNALVHRRWRTRSVKNILDELEIIESQGYKNVLFFDDNFTVSLDRVVKISEGIRKRGIKLNWFYEGRVDNARTDVFRETAKAGAKVCYFGAENATQKVLNYYNKGITPEQVKLAVKKARKGGMDFIVASFILGAPGESLRDIERTIRFMENLDIDFAQVTNLMAYPGTALWESLVAKGYIDPEKYWEEGADVNKIHPHTLPLGIVKKKVREAYARVLANRKRQLKHIWRLLKSGFRQSVFKENLKYFDKNLLSKLVGN